MDFLQPIKLLGDMLYPSVCYACNRWLVQGEEAICMHCFDSLPRTGFGFQKSNPVERLFWARLPVDFATSFFFFSEKGVIRNMLHKIKYQKGVDLAVTLGRLFASELLLSEPDFKPYGLVPIPLHPAKQRQRGFNQAEAIANGMAEVLKTRVLTNAVVRNTHTSSQTKKGRYDRWQNVDQIFSLKDSSGLAGKRIVLVDDVITTGATLESCASVFLQVPGIQIGIAGLAVAKR